ncbi:TatD family hydrolase [Megalodesulfovibrio gigas]|uniref:Putative TatD family hydrolase n=1 Tax=Megalodesulfovibrio gigas (strain ATCC 19364 / DSM 1382 / NCIMB 9332 / VKM B-1759) TaxID=1121448 RepID=T2G7H0_MEGG1|nr:TatD family hydrolase [Megalodesulfovibrio gigas]AGW12134.1 putative TatD family hydrolase [Megalodesulfovibrio gigas DSM 1382 = ATCC 19364]
MSKKKKQDRPAPETLQLPCVGVESHAHLDFKPLAEDLPAVLARARAAGVDRLLQIFLGPEAYRNGVALFEAHRNVDFAIGVHPNSAEQCTDAAVAEMEAICREDARTAGRMKAIGEIGLDYYWDRVDPAVQRAAFAAQLELARGLALPVVIHSREAHADAVAMLKDLGFAHRPVLWHCFGGDLDQAREIVAAGWHVSIPGPVTYAKNTALREAVAAIPLQRLMLETDCPYLTPEPWRGTTNEPALMAFTAVEVARCKAMDPAALWAATGETARAFFGLPAC